MNDDYEDYDEDNFESMKVSLPKVVKSWTEAALSVSHKNEIPAQIAFFVALGQIVKDFIRIPNGTNTEDTRIHFCWIQTSGTGKSTLWNFLGPITKSLNKKINDLEGYNFLDIFDVVEYTDAALIGYYEQTGVDDDGEKTWDRYAGALEGSGLAHWDEFEYSGVFEQSQHKENVIVYLNTLMNTLEGESWIITKKLKEGAIMECRCQRSVFATTYVPKHLQAVIAEKGVLQRMLCYVREVPESEQHEMRMIQLAKAGTREEVSVPVEKFANALFVLYKTVKEHYVDCGSDPFKTITYSEGFSDALAVEYFRMRKRIENCEPHVRAIASNFMTRMLKILMKLSVLCCVASSPNIKDKTKRFVVTPTHVNQAYKLTQQCYNTLVNWLEASLRSKPTPLAQQKKERIFLKVFGAMEKDSDGFAEKKELMMKVKANKVSQAQAYRYWSLVEHLFETSKSKVRLKEVKI